LGQKIIKNSNKNIDTGIKVLTGEPSASFQSVKTALFSLGLSHWKRFWLVCAARSTI